MRRGGGAGGHGAERGAGEGRGDQADQTEPDLLREVVTLVHRAVPPTRKASAQPSAAHSGGRCWFGAGQGSGWGRRGTGGGLYLWMSAEADVDDWHARALSSGAREVIAPETTPWGTRRSRVLDAEGHEWSAGTYAPGRAVSG
ncbi:hypothetical protein JCM18899A_09270 [Nocardioides sp. AN3]